MCTCKKKRIIKYLEGFFDYKGGSLPYKDVYSFLLTSLYQLDDDGNKVLVNSDNESGKFKIDIDRPVCVGSLFDNTSNLYNDIVKYGFKPVHNYDAKESENSVIIDADEDSVLPISYNKDTVVCTFSNNVRLLSLPKVNFYIYTKYSRDGILRPEFSGSYKISRNGYGTTGIYNYPTKFENTGAIDDYGNIIRRAKASVLMLPSDNADSGKFKLEGVTPRGGNINIDDYSFDSSVGYGQEVDADGNYEYCHINFVNADSNHADLVPTDSCQFIGKIEFARKENSNTYLFEVPFGKVWGIECNDIYFTKNYDELKVYTNSIKNYIDNYKYMLNSIKIGLYNTRFINKDKPMYLYNIEDNNKTINVSDTIELPVKRLPVINLTGKLLKSDFDSSKPYIYVNKGTWTSNCLLCNYDDLDSDLIFNICDYNNVGIYKKLARQMNLTIYCSSTAPDDEYLSDKNDVNATEVYRLVCQPTEMNEEVQYTLTKV